MELLENVWGVVAALLPTMGLLYLFWVIMKHIVEGDRRERAAQRAWEAEQDAAQPGKSPVQGRNTSENGG